MNLTQQLEDKKKERYFINICPNCKKQIYGDEEGRCYECSELLILNGKPLYNTEFEVVKKEELEQAIAEIKSLQVELKAWDGFLQTQIYNNSVLIDEHKIEMQKQRQEIVSIIKSIEIISPHEKELQLFRNGIIKLIEQLNQPKTEK